MRAGEVNRYDEPEIRRQRDAMVAVAEAMLRGEVGVLEGAQRMVAFGWGAGLDANDPDLLTLVGIQSQEDHLPIGSVRQYWSPEALARMDEEIAEAETVHRSAALEACESIVRQFDPGRDAAGCKDGETPSAPST